MCGERRDTSKIEITPEMIEAGVDQIRFYDSSNDYPEEWVALIYSAMERVRGL